MAWHLRHLASLWRRGRAFRWTAAGACLGLAALFVIVAFVQHRYVRYQTMKSTEGELKSWAASVQEEFYSHGHWRLEDFRLATPLAPSWLVAHRSGMAVDIDDKFPLGLVGRVERGPDVEGAFDRPIACITTIGERWLLYGRRISDGYVVVGTSEFENRADAETQLIEVSNKFGSTLADAERFFVKNKKVRADIDVALVSNSGELCMAAGGIPLDLTSLGVITPQAMFSTHASNSHTYRLLRAPISAPNGSPDGCVIVFKEISSLEGVLTQQLVFNLSLAVVSLAVALLLVLPGVLARRRRAFSVQEALQKGECDEVEFKASLQPREVVKTVAAFINTTGGQLLIGVEDDATICGIENDLERAHGSWDVFQRGIDDMLCAQIGSGFAGNWRIWREIVGDKTVCAIDVQNAREWVFLKAAAEEGSKPSVFWVRRQASTQRLDPHDFYMYAKENWR